MASPASATTTLSPQTSYLVDASVSDWGSLYGPGLTPGGLPTTGVYHSATNVDPCSGTDDVAKDGQKFDDGPSWKTIIGAATPSKNDLAAVYEGAEKVTVGGVYNDILYVAYQRCNADSGSMYAGLFIDNGDGLLPSDGANGDYLILFAFNPSKLSDATLYKRVSGAWVAQTVNASVFDIKASQTVGEAAVNLTTSGILPVPSAAHPECSTVDVGGIGTTATGYSTSSNLTDLVKLTPFPISNCATLKVDKTSAAADTTTSFGYTAKQADNGIVFGSNLDATGVHHNTTAASQNTTLAADLTIGQQDTWKNVVASPDYLVAENTPLPSGWNLKTIQCTYQDIFSPKKDGNYPTKTVTLYQDGAYTGTTFELPPSVLGSDGITASSCTIDNGFTGVRLVKQGSGDPKTDFAFTVGGTSTSLKLGGSQTFPATAGSDVVMSEGALPGGTLPWALDSIACTNSHGGAVGVVNVANRTATVTAVEGDMITCVFTNDQSGQLVVKKASNGGTGTFGITGTITGSITTSASDGTVSGTPLSTLVPAGDGYSVAETPQAGWHLDSITCDNGETNPANIHVGAGEIVTCTVANTKLASISLTKAVSGVGGDYPWSFDFTLTAPGETITNAQQTAAGTGNVTSSDAVSWGNLTPGKQYTITESGATGYNSAFACRDASGALVPDANGSTAAYEVQVTPGMVLTCAVTNAAKPADLTLKKTVTGIDASKNWSFDFTLSPAASPAGTQTASGTGPGDKTLHWTGLVPGTTYVVSEPAVSGYAQLLTCVGVKDLDSSPLSVTFVAGLGESITCAASNAAGASSLSLTKTVAGVDPGYAWHFDFTLTPGATGGGKQTASGTGPGTSNALTWSALIPGTTYVISETPNSDYTQSLLCTGIERDLDTSPTSVTFVAGLDASVACSALNQAKPSTLDLTKTVTGVAPGYAWSFGFSLSPAATGGGGQVASGTGNVSKTLHWTDLVPGTQYVISETTNGDYTQSLTCDGVTDLDSSATSVTFVAGFNQTVTCAATNAAKPSMLDLTKTVTGVAQDYQWSFDFALTPSATGGGEQSASGTGNVSKALHWTDLVPGQQYVISEATNGGYSQSLSCTGVIDLAASPTSVTFVAGFNQTVTCAATNAALPSTLRVTKTVTGVAADYRWSFDFTLTPKAVGGGTLTASGVGPASTTLLWTYLVPGQQYVISEATDATYVQSLTCAGVTDLDSNATSVTFVAGFNQDITCAATNAANPSGLQVTKTVTGVDPAYGWHFGFTLTPDATGGGLQTATGTGNVSKTLQWTDLVPGQQYVISEATNGDYTQSLTCDGVTDLDSSATSVTFVAGFDQKVTCAATNDATPSNLSLTKTVTGVAADYQWSFGFTLSPSATGGGTQLAKGTGPGSATLAWSNLVPGTQYVISEAATGDYTQSLTCDGVTDLDQSATSVTFVAGFGQTITCAAANDAKASNLSLTKTVTGVAADYQWSFGFTLAPAATGGGTQAATGTGPGSDTLTWSDLVPGTQYVISEAAYGDYTQNVECTGVTDLDQSATSVTFVAGFGQSITCAASNAAQPSTVTLAKTVGGIADAYAWSFDFTLAPAASGGGTQTISGTGNGTSEPISWSGLVPGTQYVISEATNGDYTQTLSCTGVEDTDQSDTSVTFVAGFGQAIVCAADNQAVASQLAVTKTVVGAPADYSWSFDFTLTPAAGDVGTATLTGVGDTTSDAATWTGLVPGVTYTIAETVNADFTPRLVCDGVEDLDSSVSSVTFVAGFGQEVTCVATNTVITKEVTLSATGASLGGLGIAVIFLLGGGALLMAARRRRNG